MYRFFQPVIRPLLDAAKPSVVVEIGSDKGPGTELLAPWCQENGAVLHCIDPLPKYDVEEWLARWPGVIEFHRDLSLNALVDIGPADVVCIDGDHNWYTLFHELEILGRSAAAAERPFPLTLMHDVGWPYGRRDLYYDPDTIPDAYRHPYRKGGLIRGVRGLAERGFNDHLDNAIHEGTPRNGLRTAAEDFVAAYEGDLTLTVLPGLHGLGIIIDAKADEALTEAVTEVIDRPGLLRLLEAVEDDRMTRLEAVWKTQQDLQEERVLVERAQAESARRVEKERRLTEKIESMRATTSQLRHELEQARANERTRALELAETKKRARRADEQARQVLSERDARIASLGQDQAALRRQAKQLHKDLTRIRKRRSVRLVLRLARLTRPLFRLRRGQFFRRGSGRRGQEQSTSAARTSKEGSPARAPTPPPNQAELFTSGDTGHFYALMRKLVDTGVSIDFARAWRASETSQATFSASAGTPPLVSIIMPTHNRAAQIAEAIASVLEQTYSNWELLVCDDASDDDTESVVQDFADHRIQYRTLPRGGAARARNAGLANARGPFIAYLDSDNLWHPRFLETMVGALAVNPGRYAAYSKYVDVVVASHELELMRFDAHPFRYDRLAKKNFIDLNSFVHRRTLYEHLGGFDERLVRQQDWDLILKYSFLREPLYIDRFLMLYRRSDDWNQISHMHMREKTSPAIIQSSVAEYYEGRLPKTYEGVLPSLSVLSWDICRNHFSKAYNLAEAMADCTQVQLLGFRFFGNPIFPPYRKAEPAFDTCYLPGGVFPEWSGHLAKAVVAASGDILYAVKPRLPSLGVALLANYHFGTPIILESNDLESVVATPRAGQEAITIRLADVDPADPELLNPFGPLWTGIMEGLAAEVPVRVTHNSVLDQHFGGGAYFIRNPKDERHYDPSALDRDDVRHRLGFSPDERVLLFGGMVRRHKGVFEVAELLDRADSPYRLLVVGSRATPDEDDLKSRSGDRVKFIAPVDRNEMAAINLASDAVVLWLNPEVPASRYQMPFKLTDALAMKVPIIANAIGDLEKLGRQGYLRLVPFGQTDELVAALDKIFADRDSTTTMVEAGRRLYLREFSYGAVRRNLEMILTDAAASPGTLPVAAKFAEFFSAFHSGLQNRPSATLNTRSATQ